MHTHTYTHTPPHTHTFARKNGKLWESAYFVTKDLATGIKTHCTAVVPLVLFFCLVACSSQKLNQNILGNSPFLHFVKHSTFFSPLHTNLLSYHHIIQTTECFLLSLNSLIRPPVIPAAGNPCSFEATQVLLVL